MFQANFAGVNSSLDASGIGSTACVDPDLDGAELVVADSFPTKACACTGVPSFEVNCRRYPVQFSFHFVVG